MQSLVRAICTTLRIYAALALICTSFSSTDAQLTGDKGARSPEIRPLLFETVSIKPSSRDEQFDEKVLPDGYRTERSSPARLVALAYYDFAVAFSDKVRNAPAWAIQEHVDIFAKVSNEDAPSWQNATRALDVDSAAFKRALQGLLADRFKLRAHTIPAEVDGFALVLAASKDKTKLVPSLTPSTEGVDSLRAEGKTDILQSEREMKMHFQNQPLSELALMLSQISSFTIEDRTGITGTYSFFVRDRLPIRPTEQDREDYGLPTQRWDLEPLGLKLVRSKIHTTVLVIDYIERPSPN